jgi:hypothetical protein
VQAAMNAVLDEPTIEPLSYAALDYLAAFGGCDSCFESFSDSRSDGSCSRRHPRRRIA